MPKGPDAASDGTSANAREGAEQVMARPDAPDAAQLERLRGELAALREQRERLEAEAVDLDVVLRALLAVRRAAEAGTTPELAALHEQVEKLIDRARQASHRIARYHRWIDRVMEAGHGDLVESTPALIRALRGEQERRHRFHRYVSEHLPPAACGIRPEPGHRTNQLQGVSHGQG